MNKITNIIVKSFEGVSNSAEKLANNAKFKVQEMNLTSKRKELMENISNLAYEKWQKGVVFPKDLNLMLKKVAKIDEDLNQLKAERFAYINPDIQRDINNKEKDKNI